MREDSAANKKGLDEVMTRLEGLFSTTFFLQDEIHQALEIARGVAAGEEIDGLRERVFREREEELSEMEEARRKFSVNRQPRAEQE